MAALNILNCQNMDEIEQLLSQIQAEDRDANTPKQQLKALPLEPSSNLDSLLAEVQADFTNLPLASKYLTNNPPEIEHILLQVKANYDTQDQERSQLKQQQLQAEQLKQVETLKLRAKAWLKQLDPLSTEGLWFERFAEGYATKLEAAINYLQAS